MNTPYEYNGTVVSKSTPIRKLKTVKKTFFLDSVDRDVVKYTTNGEFVVYLPRVYENVVSLRLKCGEFPPVISVGGSPGLLIHNYVDGSSFAGDEAVNGNAYYFLIDIEGLNKTDELAVQANKSTFVDNTFAKIPVSLVQFDATPNFAIQYSDNSQGENIAEYSPPIGKLDRLHLRIRGHGQQNNSGYAYWTLDGTPAGAIVNFSITFEIEYLDNVFDSFSSFETRIATRD